MGSTVLDAALDAVPALLEHIPNIQIIGVHREQSISRPTTGSIPGSIWFTMEFACYALLMEMKSNGVPRFARSAIYQLESCIAHLHQSENQGITRQFIPMLVSPCLSAEARSICLDHNVAYLDLCRGSQRQPRTREQCSQSAARAGMDRNTGRRSRPCPTGCTAEVLARELPPANRPSH